MMEKSEILEHIHRLPVLEQVELIETVLHDLGTHLRQLQTTNQKDREARNQQLIEAAKEAVEYYRTDPDVALWNALV